MRNMDNSFIYSLNTYLLSAFYVPGISLAMELHEYVKLTEYLGLRSLCLVGGRYSKKKKKVKQKKCKDRRYHLVTSAVEKNSQGYSTLGRERGLLF